VTLTHRDVADMVASVYGEVGAPAVDWIYQSGTDAKCHISIARLPPFLVVISRGSFNFRDWLHDAQALAVVPERFPVLGKVHRGFLKGCDDAWATIEPFVQPADQVVFAGHSLGAAHVSILAALMLSSPRMLEMGQRPHFTICWGEPKPGFSQLADVLKHVPGVSYRNGNGIHHDAVTYVPLTIWPALYVHRLLPIDVSAPPAPGEILDDLGPDIALHHFTLYRPATPATVIE
jgi:hypothetical protein